MDQHDYNAKMQTGLGRTAPSTLTPPSILTPTQAVYELLQSLRSIQECHRALRIKIHGAYPEPELDVATKDLVDPPLSELISIAARMANEQANIVEELASSI